MAKENVNPLPMFKFLIASGVAVSAAVLASPAAKADGFYLNPEFNAAWSGSDFNASVLEGHIGWEKTASMCKVDLPLLSLMAATLRWVSQAKWALGHLFPAPSISTGRFLQPNLTTQCWLWAKSRGQIQVLSYN